MVPSVYLVKMLGIPIEVAGVELVRISGVDGTSMVKIGGPVVVDGRNVVGVDGFIGAGFVYKGIGKEDENGHDMCVQKIISAIRCNYTLLI